MSEGDASVKKTHCYWATTSIIALELVAGGAADLANLREVVVVGARVDDVMKHLGYPDYFTRILGFWKLLGAIALLIPGYPRVKEWAYAGTFFETTGAAASHIARGDKASKLIAPLSLTAIVVASWALRPQSRICNGLSFAR
jgi:hypothetical protein